MAGKNSHARYSAGGHDSGGLGTVKGGHVQVPLQGDGESLGLDPMASGVSGDMDLIHPAHIRAQLGKGCYERGTKMHCKRPKHNKRPAQPHEGVPATVGTLGEGMYQKGPKGLSQNREA